MLKGTLEQITICGKKKIPGQSAVDAMMFAAADPDQPIRDSAGHVRTMWLYKPSSGIIPCSSGIFILREDDGCASAEDLLEKTGWAEKAERDHYLILLIDPARDENGSCSWNTEADPARQDDYGYLTGLLQSGPPQYLIGCKVHRTSRYLAGFGKNAATLAAGLAKAHAELLAGVYLEEAQEPEAAPDGTDCPVPVWASNCDEAIVDVFRERALKAHTVCRTFSTADREIYENAWDTLFFGMRRMATGIFGSLVHKDSVEEMGLKMHYEDSSLGDNGGMAHEWYEYVPIGLSEKLPVPLVFVLHGGATSAKYCAEQTRWHELAQKYGFMVIYPQACQNSVWNPGLDRRLASDEEYLVKLYDYACAKYPVDKTRVYCTGFSMGGVMSHAMGMTHAEIFAAVAPFSGLFFNDYWNGEPYRIRAWYEMAQKVAAEQHRDIRMPVFQVHGTLDTTWQGDEMERMQAFWAKWNKVPVPFTPEKTKEGQFEVRGSDGRFHIYDSHLKDGTVFYRFVSVQDLPHGVDLRTPYMAWEFLCGFSREADGTLVVARRRKTEKAGGSVLTDIQPD